MRLRRIEPILRRALRGPCRLPEGSRLLVAVSGGADSTASLVALSSIAREFGLELAAAHLHHGLRGTEADRDLEFVRALCARLGIPLQAARWDCRLRMRRAGLTGEDGLRRLRRRFLLAAARRASAIAIATAHTADDQLETVLMRLARGTGLAGLGGMRERHGAWIKPLLGATRLDIERDLRANSLAWGEDSSNETRLWLRNRVRLAAVPALLAAIAPARATTPARADEARAALARRVAGAAADARAADRLVGRMANRVLARNVGRSPASLDARGWAKRPAALRQALLARLWREAAPGSSGLPRRHREALDALLASGRRRADLTLPGGGRAILVRGMLSLHPGAPASNRHLPADGSPGRGDARLRRESPRRARTGASGKGPRTNIATRHSSRTTAPPR